MVCEQVGERQTQEIEVKKRENNALYKLNGDYKHLNASRGYNVCYNITMGYSINIIIRTGAGCEQENNEPDNDGEKAFTSPNRRSIYPTQHQNNLTKRLQSVVFKNKASVNIQNRSKVIIILPIYFSGKG